VNRGLLRLLQGEPNKAESDFQQALARAGNSRSSIQEKINQIKRVVTTRK
jgi:hypothetical protein